VNAKDNIPSAVDSVNERMRPASRSTARLDVDGSQRSVRVFSPNTINHKGHRIIITMTANAAVGIGADDGTVGLLLAQQGQHILMDWQRKGFQIGVS